MPDITQKQEIDTSEGMINAESEASQEKQLTPDEAYSVFKSLVAEVDKVIIGKHPEIVLITSALLAGGHVLIEDVPGVGKTTLASALAKAAGLSFKRAQFTPDVMASDITGFNIYNRKTESFEFREGLVMCNLLLADEINRASPKTQSSLLEAMEESRVTVDGVTYNIPDPFMVIATQNPAGYVGTYPLPEAQLDRFMIKIAMGYPTLNEEIEIIDNRRESNPLDDVKTVADVATIRSMRKHISSIKVDPKIYKYIVTLVQVTRTHPLISLGASPRASVALMRISQAFAFTRGRSYVLPDDVAAVYTHTVAHRLILKQEAKLNRISARDILTELSRMVEVPYITEREEKK
ncbi:MAG TPA: MoxR family ATPase [Bacillota bacterium]|nr:MoxR family ATPase [Bacillota bacterium]